MADHHAGLAVKACQAADDGEVVRKVAVAVQLLKVGEDIVGVIQRIGALRVPRNLRHLPRPKPRINVFGELQALLAQPLDFIRDIDCRFALHVAQFVDLGFKLGNRLFKV